MVTTLHGALMKSSVDLAMKNLPLGVAIVGALSAVRGLGSQRGGDPPSLSVGP